MFRDRRQRLINLGYLGHMWELYALWAWLPLFVAASMTARTDDAVETADVAWTVFICMGVAGAAGCVLAGRLSAQWGSPRVARAVLATSGLCCLLSPLLYAAHPALLWGFLLVWGASVIADSAQFSSALSDAADPRCVGTALTVQTASGFLLTIVSIQALPVVADRVGWDDAMAMLALGPLIGTWGMTRLLLAEDRRPHRASR